MSKSNLHRSEVNHGTDQKIFQRTAARTRTINVTPTTRRGGRRM